MRVRRLPRHNAAVPDGYTPVAEDHQPSSTTQRCLLCKRRVMLSFRDTWVHVQDLSHYAFEKQKWKLVTRNGRTKHYEVAPGETACGIHQRRRVEEQRQDVEGEGFGYRFYRCKKCEKQLDELRSTSGVDAKLRQSGP